MNETESVIGLTGRMGGVAFINAFVSAPSSSDIEFHIGWSRAMKHYAVVASIGGVTAGFTMAEARLMADALQGGLDAVPELPIKEAVEWVIAAFRKCADDIEQMTNGVKQ